MLRFVINDGFTNEEDREGHGEMEEEVRSQRRGATVNITEGSLSYDFKANEILFHFGSLYLVHILIILSNRLFI